MLKQKPSRYLFVLLSLLLYAVVGYELERHQTLPLFVCYSLLFVLYVVFAFKYDGMERNELKFLLSASILFRAILLFSVPALSDDFYRFIWDGRLLALGYHPFAEVPSFYINQSQPIAGLDLELFNKLNSKERFTSYPPVCQSVFWLSAKLSPESIFGSMMIMKAFLFIFEIATLWILLKVIRLFNLPSSAVLIYAMNPLVILELVGNLHFEGVMIFFLFASIFFLARRLFFLSSLYMAFSITTKLIPLLFLPLLARHLGWRMAMKQWIITGLLTLVLFAPLLTEEILSLSTSLGYYFQKFEFNASAYYLIREAGYGIVGFNIIQYAGPSLALMATVVILAISFRRIPSVLPERLDQGVFRDMLWCLFVYFLSTTILHPWYIITLLTLSIFTHYRFPVLWTALIFLTYAGYTVNSFEENLFLVTLEYTVVIGYLLYEHAWSKRKSSSSSFTATLRRGR